MQKQITFRKTYNSDPLYPKIGDVVYLVESQTLYTSTNVREGTKAGEVTKPVYRLSKTCPKTIPGSQEQPEGWLGAYLSEGSQKDSWSRGKWKVTSVVDKPVPKNDYEAEKIFAVNLTKLK